MTIIEPTPALIISGPKDGVLVEHPGDILEIPLLNDVDLDMTIQTATFKRVVYKVACSLTYLHVFVPIDWTRQGHDGKYMESLILSHLLTQAFKGAIGIRQSG